MQCRTWLHGEPQREGDVNSLNSNQQLSRGIIRKETTIVTALTLKIVSADMKSWKFRGEEELEGGACEEKRR